MIYRFKPSERKHETREKKPYRRAGADSPRRLYGYRADAVDLSMLFELAKLQAPPKKRRSKVFGAQIRHSLKRGGELAVQFFERLKHATARTALRLRHAFSRLREKISRMIEKRRERRKAVSDIYILTGAFVAVTVVAFVSLFAVLYKLLFSNYFGAYEKITVPDMVGMNYSEARAELREEDYNIIVSYEYSSGTPAGKIISQSPTGGVERKIFSGGALCTLNIVVSRGKEMIEIRDFVGESARDAVLELKNSAFSVITAEDFSTTVPSGCVISSSPSAGETVEAGGVVVLHVSRGEQVVMLSVPELVGFTEAEAVNRLSRAGFAVGKIDYKSSTEKAGVVISQSVASRTRAKKGTEISFSVSAGREFSDKTVPSLYGLTIAEARQKLSEYGLVCGNIYAANSNEPKGTVIAQSPVAGSSISSSLLSIDMYVSS